MVWTRDESGAPYERGLIRFCVRPGAGHTPKRVCRRDLPLYANSMVGGRRRHLAAAASPSYGTVGALGLFLRRILLSTTAAFGIPAFSFLCQRIRQDSRDVRRQTQEPPKRPREAVLGAERKRSRRGPPPLPCYWPKAENLPGTPALGRAWIVEIRKNRMSPIFFLPSSFLSSRVAAPGRVGLFLKGVKRVAASRPVGLGDGPAHGKSAIAKLRRGCPIAMNRDWEPRLRLTMPPRRCHPSFLHASGATDSRSRRGKGKGDILLFPLRKGKVECPLFRRWFPLARDARAGTVMHPMWRQRWTPWGPRR